MRAFVHSPAARNVLHEYKPLDLRRRNQTIINIRLTQADHVHLLPEIERSAGESFHAIPDLAWIADDEDMSAETHLLYVVKGTSWVVESDDQIIGFLCAEPVAGDLHIWELAVRQGWQGIGQQLMKTAIGFAHSNRFGSVTLTTFCDVPWNELFYHSLGFETIEKEKLDRRLEQILITETQHGLPGDRRCAMRLQLSPMNAESIG